MLLLAGSRTPPRTPPPPMVSQRDPLGLWDRPRIPSPKTARVSEKRSFVGDEFRPATQEWEDAGLLPGAEPQNAAPEFNSYWSVVPRHLEWFYLEGTTVERTLRWQGRL